MYFANRTLFYSNRTWAPPPLSDLLGGKMTVKRVSENTSVSDTMFTILKAVSRWTAIKCHELSDWAGA